MFKIETPDHLSHRDREKIDNDYQERNESHQEQDQISRLREECNLTDILQDDKKCLTKRNACNRFLTSEPKFFWRDKNKIIHSGSKSKSEHTNSEIISKSVMMPVEFGSYRSSGTQSRRLSSSELISTGLPRSASTSSQSDFFESLYKKYPQAFLNRLSNFKTGRPSRRLFSSSGLRVHFEDDQSSIDDASSIYSERPSTKWEKEAEEMLGAGSGLEDEALVSPTPSIMSDIVTSNRLHATSETLKRLLQHRKYHRSKLASDLEHRMKRHSISSNISDQDPLSVLEKELEHREQMLQALNRQRNVDHNYNIKHSFRSSNWRVQSPESPPDSAIDVDTSSVQSASSGDRPVYTTSGSCLGLHDDLPNGTDTRNKKYGKILVRKGVVHKDSDVDSGIIPALVSDKRVFCPPPPYTTTVSSRSEVEFSPINRQFQRSGPMKADHSIALNLNFSHPTDEEDSIAQEIVTAQMAADIHQYPLRHLNSRVHFEDEVDDTDPRLGIPAVTKEEKKVMEIYRKRRSPTQFVVKRSSTTAKDEKVKSNSQARSNNHVSILCSPRKNEEVLILTDKNSVDMAGRERYNRSETTINHQGKYSSFYCSQPNLSSTFRISPQNGNTDENYSGQNGNFEDLKPKMSSRMQVVRQEKDFISDGALDLQQTKSLSKSQPNLAPSLEISSQGRQPVSRTSSSNSEQSSLSPASTQLAVNGNNSNSSNSIVCQSNPFTAKNTMKKMHLKKYFKTKKGCYNPSLEESCLDVELGHGTSMPDLRPNSQKECVPYSHTSTHSSMQNIYFKSKDSDSEEDEMFKPKQRPQKHHSSKSGLNSENISSSQMNKDKGRVVNLEESRFCKSYKQLHDRRYESDSSSSQSYNGAHNKRGGLTPYESAVLHIDKQGLDVNELIESDSDSFSAKRVVIDKDHCGRQNPAPQTNSSSDIYHQERRYRKKGGRPHTPTKPIEITKQLYSDVKGRKPINCAYHVPHKACAIKNPNQQDALAKVSISSSVSSLSSQDTNDKAQDVPNDGANSTYTVHKGSELVADRSDNVFKVNRSEQKIQEGSASHIYAEVNVSQKSKNAKGRPLSENLQGIQIHSILSASTPDLSRGHGRCVDIRDVGDDMEQMKSSNSCNDSNLVKSKEMSASRQSLADKMGTFKDSAKKKFKAIRKAVSMDKGIDSIGDEGQGKVKDKKKKKGFLGLFRKRSKRKGHAEFREMPPELETNGSSNLHTKWSSCHSIDSVRNEHTTGSRLCSVNSDGTQIVEIRKSQNKAIDFFISRGNSQFKHGIFVSRFIGTQTDRYSGLLSVGDEILEVNGFKVSDLLLDDVYGLLSNTDRLVLTILPLLARKDI